MRIHFIKTSEKGTLENYLELDDVLISQAYDRISYITEQCRETLTKFFLAEDEGPQNADPR